MSLRTEKYILDITNMETLEQTKDRNIKLTLLDFLKRNNDEKEYQSDYIENDWKIRRDDC